jgi:hypothetical protein
MLAGMEGKAASERQRENVGIGDNAVARGSLKPVAKKA